MLVEPRASWFAAIGAAIISCVSPAVTAGDRCQAARAVRYGGLKKEQLGDSTMVLGEASDFLRRDHGDRNG